MRFSDEEVRRYARQMVLPEVGGVGQERLRAAHATASSEVEALYLAAAGLGHLTVPSRAIAESVRALNPLCTVAVDAAVSAGRPFDGSVEGSALRALATLRRALEL